MVQSKNIFSLVVLPTLALATPSLHHRHADAHHKFHERALTTVLETTYIATTTVTWGHLPSDPPKPAKVNANEIEANVNAAEGNEAQGQNQNAKQTVYVSPVPVAPSSTSISSTSSTSTSEVVAEPTEAPPAPPAPKPKPKPSPAETQPKPKPGYGDKPAQGSAGQFAIKNNCDYDMTMTIDRTMCGPIERDIPIASGETWYGEITACNDANPSYKIYKEGSHQPLQLEAGYKPDQKTLWYNISPKDCVSDMYGAGITNCPGGPWSLSAVSTASNPGACQKFQCHDATSCCTSSLGAYCDAWATAAKALGGEEPVGGCLGSINEISLVAQLC